MAQSRLISFSIILASLLFVGAGCISVGTNPNVGAGDGGIFKSADKGDTWAQKTAIPTTSGEKRSISGTSIVFITQDPQDANAIYAGTTDNGMFYSYDGGESWMQPPQVNRGRIPYIAVHPKNKCIVYVTTENKLVKTEDCSRTWTVPFLDARSDKKTKVVAIDSYNPDVVWLGTSSGDLLRSVDAGGSWVNVKNFNDDLLRLIISPSDTRHIYVATKASGVWRSLDGGVTWDDLSKNYKDFAGAREFSDLALAATDARTLVMSSKFGLIRTTDGGDTWTKIDLLTPPGSTSIYSLALDPKDPNNIYYGTSTTFYRSPNGGVNWVPKKLPTSRTATFLMVDGVNSSVLYMGVTKFK